MKQLKSLNNVFGKSSELNNLIAKANKLEALNLSCQNILQSPLKGTVKLVELKGDTAIFACKSAAFATQLQFMAPNLINHFKQVPEFCGVRQIKAKVDYKLWGDPDDIKPQSKKTAKLALSPQAKSSLLALQQSTTSAELKQALGKLLEL